MRMTADAWFFKTDFNAFFFHFTLHSFAKIAFCVMQIIKGKLTLRKIENMQLWPFVSSVAPKTKLILAVSSQIFQMHALKNSVSSGHWKRDFYTPPHEMWRGTMLYSPNRLS